MNGRVDALDGNGERVLTAVARRVSPGFDSLAGGERERFLEIVDDALMDRPAGVRRQLAVFLRLVRWLPVLRWGEPFERLSGERADAMLRFLQDGPVDAFRKGFMGLRTLILMGYYGREAAWPEIGYEPDRSGNERLHADS